MSEIVSKKRSRLPEEGVDKENATPTAQRSSSKKQRVVVSSAQPDAPSKPTPDPYYTLPPPSTPVISLIFQLHKFKGVYRIVEVPLNYTFANLHTLVQYIFGWQGNHSHRTRVYTNVEMYKSLGRENWIKSFGQAPPCPEEWYTETMDEDTRASVRYWFERQHEDAAIYEVVAVGKDTKSRGLFMDYDWHYKVQDHELTLGEIWNEDEDLNFSAGSWKNREIGIVYEYEIGCPWRVDITVEGFGTRENASNGIYFKTAKGAPPVEQKYEWDSDHPDGAKKTISDLLFDSANWKRYCKKQIGTRARRDELVVYVRQKGAMTDEQVKAKQAELEKTAKPIRKQRDKDERQRLKEMRARLKEERGKESGAGRAGGLFLW